MTGVRGWLAALSVVLAVASCGAVGTVAPQGIPIPSADFVAGTVGNVTYILLPTQSYQYEPASGAWKSVLEGINVSSAASAVVGNTMVVVGGGGQEGVPQCIVLQSMAGAAKMTSCQRMPTPRGFLAAAAVDGVVYAVGGYAAIGWDVVESFDVASGTWTPELPKLPTPRFGLSAAAVDGNVYTMGGIAWHTPVIGSVEAYNPATKAWTKKSPMMTPRSFMAVQAHGSSIYTFGGADATGNTNVVEVYDTGSDTWKQLAALPKPPRSHAAAVVQSGNIFVIGGSTGKNLNTHDIDNCYVFAL